MTIKLDKLGFVRSAVLFNQRAASCLTFIAQLMPPSSHAVKTYNAISQIIASAPFNAFSGKMLANLTCAGFKVEVTDLGCLGLAARFRAGAAHSLPSALVDKLHTTRSSDDVVLAALNDQFYHALLSNTSIYHVSAAAHHPLLQPLLRNIDLYNNNPDNISDNVTFQHVQAEAIKILN